MAVAGLGTYQSMSMNYSVRSSVRNMDPDDENPFMGQMLSFQRKDKETVRDADGNSVNALRETDSRLRIGDVQSMSPMGAYGELKPYTRCITANIKTTETVASETDGEMIYSYKEEEKSFSIFINFDGEKKTYTIKGVDENGQDVEEEFDPYELDPKMMNFPEFSALCMYIRQTDETADLLTKLAFTDTRCFDNFFERGDRISALKDYAEEYREAKPSLSKLASGMFEAINEFFEKMSWNKAISDDRIALLLEDRDKKDVSDAADLLKMFEEQISKNKSALEENTDWRSMSDDEWDEFIKHGTLR